jgi:hypothetical protein
VKERDAGNPKRRLEVEAEMRDWEFKTPLTDNPRLNSEGYSETLIPQLKRIFADTVVRLNPLFVEWLMGFPQGTISFGEPPPKRTFLWPHRPLESEKWRGENNYLRPTLTGDPCVVCDKAGALRALGNSVVAAQAELAIKTLIKGVSHGICSLHREN